jgi:hypothetical protein
MIKVLRDRYNWDFRPSAYEAFLQDLDRPHPGAVEFRVAETPVFVPRSFLTRMEETCDYVLDLIADPSFMDRTRDAIPPSRLSLRCSRSRYCYPKRTGEIFQRYRWTSTTYWVVWIAKVTWTC